MTTMSVIPNFNVLKERGTRGSSGEPFSALEQLPAQRCKEALGDGIVIAVAAPTHADTDVMRGQQFTIIGGGILDAAIAVMEQSGLRVAPPQSHAQSGQAQFRFQRL